jgi:hypothetical protein
LTGSGSDFRKRPDPVPDPDPNKFSANFFLNIFLMKICSQKYLHEPKSNTTEIPEVSLAFTLGTKKVEIGSFFKDRIRIRIGSQKSGSDQKGPDPTRSETLLCRVAKFFGGDIRLSGQEIWPSPVIQAT